MSDDMTIQTDHTPVSTQPSKILWQWRITLCDRDMLAGHASLQAAVRSVREETTDAQHDEARAWLAVDWAVRTLAPTWLAAAGLSDEADTLRSLPPVTSPASASSAHDALEPAVEAGRRASDTEHDALCEARQHSRSQMIELEHVASAGDRVVMRQSCGQLVEMAAREGISDRAGREVVAVALLAARSAAQVVAWRCLAQDQDMRTIVDAVQTSAVELYMQMGDVQHGQGTSSRASQPAASKKPTRIPTAP